MMENKFHMQFQQEAVAPTSYTIQIMVQISITSSIDSMTTCRPLSQLVKNNSSKTPHLQDLKTNSSKLKMDSVAMWQFLNH